ncbi:hypothetical protein PG996_002752 [Apiospora saccharicola]|uniref:NAD(P)-binding protein n=1 Tax=Apiospora saccharicola TaxID=335842 RepID=A0ABR1WKE0_9PEZI
MGKENLVPLIRQSKPIDITQPVQSDDVRGRIILITGGASPHQHYRHCDVASWESQAAFFRDAVALSPHGGIDAVVANAGIADTDFAFCRAQDKKNVENGDVGPGPAKPNLGCLDVNITGVAYTAHLAMYWLSRNPGSSPDDLGKPRTPDHPRDRHLLLLGSVASLWPVALQTQYATSKHAVLGLFRSLRGVAGWQSGIRVNMLCPYIIATPIFPPSRAWRSRAPRAAPSTPSSRPGRTSWPTPPSWGARSSSGPRCGSGRTTRWLRSRSCFRGRMSRLEVAAAVVEEKVVAWLRRGKCTLTTTSWWTCRIGGYSRC